MIFSKAIRFVGKNSSAILSGCAIGGSVMACVFSVTGTLEADRILQVEPSLDADADKRDILAVAIRKTWKCYLPAGVSLAAAIACIVCAHRVNMAKQASLMAALAYSGDKINDIRKELGEEQFKKIEQSISDNNKTPMPKEELTDGQMWCWEPVSGQWLKCTTESILWAELTANKIFNNQNELTINELLSLFNGAKKMPGGDEIGWFVYDEDGCWDFNWSFYRGNPWIDIQPVIVSKNFKGNKFGKEYLELDYSMGPSDKDLKTYVPMASPQVADVIDDISSTVN